MLIDMEIRTNLVIIKSILYFLQWMNNFIITTWIIN